MKIIFLAGPHGSGKTYTANYLTNTCSNFLHLDIGPIVRTVHRDESPQTDLNDWFAYRKEKHGKSFLQKIVCPYIQQNYTWNKNTRFIITGCRSVSIINQINDFFHNSPPQIIYIDSPFSLLKENYENREKQSLSDIDFTAVLDSDIPLGINKLKQFCIDNHDNDTIFYIFNEKNNNKAINQIKELMKLK